MEIQQPTDPADIAILKMSEGMQVYGSITLPSGYRVPEPPKGHVWMVRDGKIVAEVKG